MKLSIIVPTLNEQWYLPSLLRSVTAQNYSHELEVIVVDASANLETCLAAEEFSSQLKIVVIRTPIRDVGAQRNIGVDIASYSTLLFLDADVVLGPGVLKQCEQVFSARSAMFVGSIRHVPDRGSVATYVTLAVIYALIAASRVAGFPVTNGDFLLTNKRTHARLGGFREGFLLGEDTDFGLRARKVGAKSFMIWSRSVVASSRRLELTSALSLARTWVGAFVHVLRGRGPVGDRNNDDSYPYGRWG